MKKQKMIHLIVFKRGSGNPVAIYEFGFDWERALSEISRDIIRAVKRGYFIRVRVW